MGEKGVLYIVEQYRKLGTPTTANETPDAEFEKGIKTWAKADVDASEREDGVFGGL